MEKLPRPRVVVSKCLGFEACRWNGDMIRDEFTEKLAPFVDFQPVCPEMEIGLGVPRKPVRLVDSSGAIRMVQLDTGLDCTDDMQAFGDSFLNGLKEVDGFLLKGRSPSCGPVDVKIYTGTQKGAMSRRGQGMFGDMVLARFPGAAVEHEGRVHNFSIREHFLTKLFCLARFRAVKANGGMGELVKFQAAHKLLLMAYNQEAMRKLGRIVANPDQLPPVRVLAAYEPILNKALARIAAYTSHINVLMHAMGYFKHDLNEREKSHFLDSLERYRAGKAPLSTLLALLGVWIARWGQDYLESQIYFNPYPLELFEITDSGKGRDY
jgi:uncharacterized protein YbgA (DUF1722 family)/uncharacterized protein YbbK (DUF523 family)